MKEFQISQEGPKADVEKDEKLSEDININHRPLLGISNQLIRKKSLSMFVTHSTDRQRVTAPRQTRANLNEGRIRKKLN